VIFPVRSGRSRKEQAEEVRLAKLIAKLLLYIAVPVVLGLILWNGYSARRHLDGVRRNTETAARIAQLQARTARIAADFGDIETAQLGFLISGDPGYLQPYTDARAKLGPHFAELRVLLAGRSAAELAAERRLEALAHAQVGEIDETVQLRQKELRHRAFLIVNSGRGQKRMDEARTQLATLDAAAARDLVRIQQDTDAAIDAAVRDSRRASVILFVVSALVFAGFLGYLWFGERQIKRTIAGLRQANADLDVISSTIDRDVRTRLTEVQGSAQALIDGYASFLPNNALQQVERIRQTTEKAEQQLHELQSLPNTHAEAA
jgi:CHASE3 domain sensor protein